jgi:hypothetical protein
MNIPIDSIFTGSNVLGYAETHFKFQLPWSKLHSKWPEVFVDAPFQVLPGLKIPIWLVVKDAHLFPIVAQSVLVHAQHEDGLICRQKIDLNMRVEESFLFHEFDLNFSMDIPGKWKLMLTIEIINQNQKSMTFVNWNYPHLLPIPLEIRRLSDRYNVPSGFYAGEHHCHSWYTSDPVEFGASPQVLQRAAECVGLDYTVITDHSYNFYYDSTHYMNEIDPRVKWAKFIEELDGLNEVHPDLPRLIPGLEVSCGNEYGQNIHLLVMGLRSFVDGHGDGGRRWFNNKPDLQISEVLALTKGCPAFAAHPKAQIGLLERLVFRRGFWTDRDLAIDGLSGTQFWNGQRGGSFSAGKEAWLQLLAAGVDQLPIAGNDAHGDLNINTYVKTPLFKLGCHRKHLFGQVRTLVQAKSCSEVDLKNAFIEKKSICLSDGPFLTIELHKNSLNIIGFSSIDFGALELVVLFVKRLNIKVELEIRYKIQTFAFDELWSIMPDIEYVRLECVTAKSCRAMTKAFFL